MYQNMEIEMMPETMKQIRFFLTSVLVVMTTTMTAQTSGDETQTSQFESAKEAVANMRLGWNLGNTLESNSGDTLNMWIEANKSRTYVNYETAWGQKVTQARLFKMFKEAGFNAIRVPVTWYPHMEATFNSVRGYDDHGTWRYTPWLPSQDPIGKQIQTAWMNRVKQVVDYVLAQGMYCILNIHHDTGEANTAWLVADEEVYAQERERFETIWTQIAETFKDYDEHLLFEGYNEMLDKRDSWCYASFKASNQYNAKEATSAYNAINSYAQSFVNAVRATGGNNVVRNLIISTYGACDGHGSWSAHLQDPLKKMTLPNDTVEGHLIFEVHGYPDISNLTTAKQEVRTTINHLKRNLAAKGAPIIFGEWGASNGNAYSELRANMLSFARYFVEQTKAAGIGTFYWMGLSDGASRLKPEFSQPDLVDALVKGYYGEGGYIDGIRELRAETLKTGENTDQVYDMSGCPVSKCPNSPKGIFIVDGKKVLTR